MKYIGIVVIASLVLLGSCSDQSSKQTEAPVTTTELNSEVNKSLAKLYVTGLTCQAGCGGKIEKELQALAGVRSTETLFEENRPENIINVEFDPAAVDAKAMELCIEKIMEGKYQVQKIEVLNYHGLQSHNSGGAGVDVSPSGFSEFFKLLNVFQSLGRLLSTDL